MATVVVPFRSGGKSRLPAEVRADAALAMLADVLGAAAAHADRVRLVTDDDSAAGEASGIGAEIVADPGDGLGAAVFAALTGIDGNCLVVNADLPCATTEALARLLAYGPASVPAADGTTNALSLPDPTWFRPHYGPGSAARFKEAGLAPVSIPELEQDVDTLSDLLQLTLPVGPRTAIVLDQHSRDLGST